MSDEIDKKDDEDEDSERTPAHTPDARRASQRGQAAVRPCPGCNGRELRGPSGETVVCAICDGVRFSTSTITQETWKLRIVLAQSKPPKPNL